MISWKISVKIKELFVRLGSIFTKISWQDAVKRYWKWEVDDEKIYERICNGYSMEDFGNYTSSIVWQLNPAIDDICLNIGCGIGRVEKFLAPKVKKIHSVDFSETMIKKAKERLKDYTNVFFYKNDGQTLSAFPDNMFDIAWSELVFQHIPKDIIKNYIKEIHRTLKPKGRFISLIPRLEKYGNSIFCGGMSYCETMETFALFSNVTYIDIDKEHYITPLATK